jgi:hypothetical protein
MAMRGAFFAVGVVCITLLASAWAQEETVQLKAEVRFLQSAREATIRYLAPTHRLQWRNQPPKEIKLPNWAKASCRYGVLRVGKPLQDWHVIMDSVGSRVVVDLNRNNDLTDDEVLRSSPDLVWFYGVSFGPFRLTVPIDGVPTSRYFSLVLDDIGSRQTFLRSEDYRLFEGEVNGKAFKIALLDANADGAFDTPAKTRWDGDRCVFLPDRQQRPVPRFYQLGGRTYRLTFASDGSTCEFQPTEIGTGTLVTEYPEVHLIAIGKQVGYWEASTTDGRLQLPADEYSVQTYRFGTRDSKGNLWRVEITPMDPITVKVTDGENKFPLPKQLTASLGFGTRRGDTVEVALTLSAGNWLHRVTSLEMNGELPPPPTLRIVDRNGKTVKVEKFHYG